MTLFLIGLLLCAQTNRPIVVRTVTSNTPVVGASLLLEHPDLPNGRSDVQQTDGKGESLFEIPKAIERIGLTITVKGRYGRKRWSLHDQKAESPIVVEVNEKICRAQSPMAVANFGTLVAASAWSEFRGATGAGLVLDESTPLPTEWSDDRVHWHVELEGAGNSSPAVVGDQIYVTSQKDDALFVTAISVAAGKIAWNESVGQLRDLKQNIREDQNAASPSPCADLNRVWALFGDGTFVCLTRDGKTLWRESIWDAESDPAAQFGYSSSPRLWHERLFICNASAKGLDVLSHSSEGGDLLWRRTVDDAAGANSQDIYATPLIHQSADRGELVVSAASRLLAFDLAHGEQNWEVAREQAGRRSGVITSPVQGDGVLVSSAGRSGELFAVPANESAGTATNKVLWYYDKSTPDVSTPICYRGCICFVNDKGIATCLDTRSGEQKWQVELAKGPYYASPIAGRDRVYFLNTQGTCTIVDIASGSTIATNSLTGRFYATPVIGEDGTIYFRSSSGIHAIAPDFSERE